MSQPTENDPPTASPAGQPAARQSSPIDPQAIDQDLALGSACAVVQAYKAYAAGAAFPPNPLEFISAPVGWRYVTFWYGVDVFNQPIVPQVLFGLVFQSTADPSQYLFAFRGTEGYEEWWDDVHVAHTPFRPYVPGNGPAVPAGALIEDGFGEIYSSMQSALFTILGQLSPAPSRLFVSGHSLGGPLCEYFSLDVLISRPSLPVTTLNHAAARPGNATFAGFYDSLTLAKGNPTTRVVNKMDIVPCLPFEDLGYRQVGVFFQLCFTQPGILPDYGLRHSIDNYFNALCRAFGRSSCPCALRQEQTVSYCTADGVDTCDWLWEEVRGSGPKSGNSC